MGELRKLTILGSTGSIGQSTLDIVAQHPGLYEIETLTANRHVDLLADQAIQFRAKRVVIADTDYLDFLRSKLAAHPEIKIEAGEDALAEAASEASDLVMAAIVGIAGLKPIYEAARAGTTILLANKEALICGGYVLLETAKKHDTTILPVDSEHNAIFQALEGSSLDEVEKVTLTASGGPFRTWTYAQMEVATLEQALKHPNWDMGAKVTLDCATMVNKGLELMEAHYLFGLSAKQLDVVVHPQSIIHSVVAYHDGSSLAQMSVPDMRVPIAHCLAYPKRIKIDVPRMDLAKLSMLSFEMPDYKRFPALRLAKEILAIDPSQSLIFNAANEVAVQAFMDGKIGFLDIAKHIEYVLENHPHTAIVTLQDILDTDRSIRKITPHAKGLSHIVNS